MDPVGRAKVLCQSKFRNMCAAKILVVGLVSMRLF